jgi:sec-independent protein translocase protein TatB
VARTLGLLFGRAQRYVNGVRADIERDMQLDEVRKIKQTVENEVMSIEHSAKQTIQSVEQQVQSLEHSAEPVTNVESNPGSIPAATPVSKPKELSTPVQQQFPND